MKYLNDKDVLSGLMFSGLGVVSLILSSAFDFGSTARPGPGFFPLILSVLLIFMGLVVALRAGLSKEAALPPIVWQPLALVTLSVILFAVLVERIGLMPSVFIGVVVATFARPNFGLIPRLALAAGLAVFSAFLFIGLLRLPVALWSF